MVVGAMTSPGYGVSPGMMAAAGFGSSLRMTLASRGDEDNRQDSVEKRRASVPALFGFGEGHPQERDEAETPTSYKSCDKKETTPRKEDDIGDLGIVSIDLTS
jgi:hypothetical protein